MNANSGDTYAVEPIQPDDDPLTITRKRIYARRRDHHETMLMATAQVVNLMSERQARIVYDALVGRPLTVSDADLAQLVAQRLGIEPAWQHCDLVPGATWQPERKAVK